MVNSYAAPLPDPEAYLRRLGLAGAALPPTRATLDAVIWAHVTHIPFETFSLLQAGTAPSLEIPAVFHKIVTCRRGGWCFELNALLHGLLEHLGFSVRAGGAHIALRDPSPGPVDHRLIFCQAEGQEWLCDVGFGGALSRCAIPMDGTATADGARVRPLENGELGLFRTLAEGREKLVMRFSPETLLPEAFLEPNRRLALPGSHLTGTPACVLLTEQGPRELRGCRYREPGQPERTVADSEIPQLLKDRFGLAL